MSNVPQSDLPQADQPNNLPQDAPPPNDDLTFGQYLKQIFDTLKSAIILAPIFLVLIVIILSMMGPRIGNVFSNIVSAL